jgi:uncharacterized protein (DUF488 family)
MRELLTIGAYGFEAARFFQALREAGVDTFCDIRWRRGVRGRDYAWANHARLAGRLAELGIRYVHLREVAPPPELRSRQITADAAAKVAKRQRLELSPDFIAAYQLKILAGFNAQEFVPKVGAEAQTVALFCVEREPAACHRSLLAAALQQQLGIVVRHLTPA